MIRAEHRRKGDDGDGDEIWLVTNEVGRVEKTLGRAPSEEWEDHADGRAINITPHWEGIVAVFEEDNSMDIAREIAELAFDLFGDEDSGDSGSNGEAVTGEIEFVLP